MTRRSFVGAIAGAAVALAARPARAASRVRGVTFDARGTTLALDLDHAPFPAAPPAAAGYADRTVFVFVPHHHRVERDGKLSVVCHFHGHNTTAERAMVAHELREQLYDSKQNAILVVPQGPVMSADSSCGKLEAQGGLARMLADVAMTLRSQDAAVALGTAGVGTATRIGTVCLSAHSGGYHAAAQCVKVGGVEVNEVYLFDALYANEDTFRDWVIAGKGRGLRYRHKLISYYGAGAATETESQRLLAELERADVRCAYEKYEGTLSREELTESDAVFVRTSLSHNGVTHELNALRDCLFASGLPRRLRTAWFEHKDGSRVLERRRP